MEWEITKCLKIFANDIIRDVYAQNPEFSFFAFSAIQKHIPWSDLD
jgi:hypothetical protein